MNASLEHLHLPRSRAAGWTAAFAGLTLLFVRPYLTDTGGPPVPLQLGIFAALFVVSVAGPSPGTARSIHPVAALGFGATAFWMAGLVSGPQPPMAYASVVVAVALNSVAAVSEEAFFRRFLYGKLVRWGPAVAIVISSLAFAFVHLSTYGLAAMPVDVGAGLVLGWQRWASGSWLVPAATHVWANVLVVLR